MVKLQEIEEFLKSHLSKKRYIHSLGTREEAVRLAQHYNADFETAEKAGIAGLVHDATKDMTYPEHLKVCEDSGIILSAVEKSEEKLLHAITAAEIAQRIFFICDEEIISAVRYHTTGKANMGFLDKILFLADYIEPNREFDGVEEIRKRAYVNLDKAMLCAIDMTISELLKKKALIHGDTIEGRNHLIEEERKLEWQR